MSLVDCTALFSKLTVLALACWRSDDPVTLDWKLFDLVSRSLFQLDSVPHTWPTHWLAETVVAAVVELELLELEPPPQATPAIPRHNATLVILAARATDQRCFDTPRLKNLRIMDPHSAVASPRW